MALEFLWMVLCSIQHENSIIHRFMEMEFALITTLNYLMNGVWVNMLVFGHGKLKQKKKMRNNSRNF